MKRILWNRRPSPCVAGDIDEIVLTDVSMVHVEQMSSRSWWIGVTLADGSEWSGDFVAGRGRMMFLEQESTVEWDRDETHEEAMS